MSKINRQNLKGYWPLDGYGDDRSLNSSLLAGLVAYYKLDDVNDSKNAYTLTNNNSVTFPTGKIGNGAEFGSANINKSLSRDEAYGMTYNSPRSISGWIKINTLPGTDGVTYSLFDIMFGSNPGNYSVVSYRKSGSLLQLTTNTGGNYTVDLGTTTWHHIVLTHDHVANQVKLYLDGSLLYTDPSFTSDYSAQTTRFAIGRFQNTNFSSAIVDEVGLWNKILTQAEILNLYLNGYGKQYPFISNITVYGALPAPSKNQLLPITLGYKLNGSSDRLIAVNSGDLNITGDFTVMGWFKFNSLPSNGQYPILAQKYLPAGNQRSWQLSIGNNAGNYNLYFQLSANGSTAFGNSPSYNPDLRWHHIACTFKASTATKIYIDGKLFDVNTTSIGASIYASTADVMFGSDGTYFLNGMLQEFALFNTELSHKQISEYYRSLKGRYMNKIQILIEVIKKVVDNFFMFFN